MKAVKDKNDDMQSILADNRPVNKSVQRQTRKHTSPDPEK